MALLLAFILALGACSGDSDAKNAAASTTGQAVTTTPTSTVTTATTEDPEAAVLAAYRAFWADVVAAGKTFGLRDAPKSLPAGLDVEMPFAQQRAHHLPAALEAGTVSWEDVDRAALRILAT